MEMDTQISKLENGLTIITRNIPHLESATINVLVKAGARNERKNQHGVAHFLEHMAFKGTKQRSARQIVEAIEDVGGDINAMTSVETTAYYVRVLRDDVPLAVDILHDILENSTFDEGELEREQHVVLQEIGASNDSPDDVAYDLFQQGAFVDQAIGRPILGVSDTISSFTAQHLNQYLSEHYTAPNMIISGAGAIDHDEITAMAKTRFSDFSSRPTLKPTEAYYTGGEIIQPRKLMETQILLGFEGRAYHARDFYALQILAGILGGGMSSRLFQQVRENHGLCYSIHAFHWGFSDTGVFGIHAATGGEDVEKLIPVILDELLRACERIDEEEVLRARAQVRSGLLMSQESSIATSEQIARQTLLYGRPISNEELMERINAITAQRLCDLAGRLFTSSKLTLAAVGPTEKLMRRERIVEYLGIVPVLATQ